MIPLSDREAEDASWTRATVGFAVKLLLAGAPVIGLLLAAHSKSLWICVGVVVAALILLVFPRTDAVRLVGVALVLAPDTVSVFEVSGSPLTLRMLAFLGLYVAVAVGIFRQRLRLTVPVPVIMSLLLLAAVTGCFLNHRPKSLLEFGVVLFLPPIAGAILASDRQICLSFLSGVTVGSVALLGVAFAEALMNRNFLISSSVLDSSAIGSFARGGHVRTNAGWDYPTMLSAFFCLAAFLVVELFRRRWGFLGLIAGTSLVLGGVITTQSRSGLLGLAAGLVVFFILQRGLGQSLRVLIALAVAAVVILELPGVVPMSFRDFVTQSFTAGSVANANVDYRQQLYSSAWSAMSQHPFFGYGYGSGKSVATSELRNFFGSDTDLASLPVSLAIQLGYAGAAAIGAILLSSIVRLMRAQSTPKRMPIIAGLIACIVAMLGVPVSSPLTWMLLMSGVGLGLVELPDQVAACENSSGSPSSHSHARLRI